MKTGKFETFATLRRCYDTLEDLGAIINKGRLATFRRLKGENDFTIREQGLILDDLIRRGIETAKEPETYIKYFGGNQ